METITEEEFGEIKKRVEELYKLFGKTGELERRVWEREFGSQKVVYPN